MKASRWSQTDDALEAAEKYLKAVHKAVDEVALEEAGIATIKGDER